jgi:hypothetical protein
MACRGDAKTPIRCGGSGAEALKACRGQGPPRIVALLPVVGGSGCALRAGHFAAGIVSPVAIDAHHTPLDPPRHADEAKVLADGIIHRPPPAI